MSSRFCECGMVMDHRGPCIPKKKKEKKTEPTMTQLLAEELDEALELLKRKQGKKKNDN